MTNSIILYSTLKSSCLQSSAAQDEEGEKNLLYLFAISLSSCFITINHTRQYFTEKNPRMPIFHFSFEMNGKENIQSSSETYFKLKHTVGTEIIEPQNRNIVILQRSSILRSNGHDTICIPVNLNVVFQGLLCILNWTDIYNMRC